MSRTLAILATEAEVRSGNTAQRAAVVRWLNDLQREICNYLFTWQIKQLTFMTVNNYTTGTVTTDGTNTITGAGTAWTTAMIGRKFFVTGQAQDTVYRIIARPNATTLTLDTIYRGANATGASYRIFQDEYTMPWDCISLETLAINGVILEKDARIPQLRQNASPNVPGLPSKYFITNYTLTPYYSTGTITVAGTTVTGAGTTFEGGMVDRWIMADTQAIVFRITSVTNATELIVNRAGLSAAVATYQIDPPPRMTIAFDVPTDDVYRCDIWYYRRIPDLVNNNDLTEIPAELVHVLQNGAYLKFLQHQREFNEALVMANAEWETSLFRAKQLDDKIKHKGRTPRIRLGYEKTLTGSWA